MSLNAIITVTKKRPPEGNRKNGGVQDALGVWYSVPPSMFGMMMEGAHYNLAYRDNTWNGKTYHMVESIMQVQSPEGMTTPRPQQTPQQQRPASATYPGPATGAMLTAKDALILAEVILKEGIRVGTVNVLTLSDVLQAMDHAHAAFEHFKARIDNPQRNDTDMNDELPY